MQTLNGKKIQNALKSGFGKVLGSIWERFGTIWGHFRALMGASWPFLGRSKTYFLNRFFQDGLQKVFWIDFGSILEGSLGGFGSVLGRIFVPVLAFWEGSGKIF